MAQNIASGSVNLQIVTVFTQISGESYGLLQSKIAPEARQTFSNWATQTIRLLPGQNYIEFEWTLGPLPQNKDSKT